TEALPLPSRVDNETLRCRPDVIKRIARHQCELRIFSSMQHLNIIRVDNFRAVHSVSKGPVKSRQRDQVIGTNLAHRPKKSVAVCCDPDVSDCARKGSAWNMAGSDAQNARIRAFQNDHGNVNARNFDAPDDVSGAWLGEHLISRCVPTPKHAADM